MHKSWIVVCLCLIGCMPNYSDGSRVGVVTKLSHKGMIWKSWEGEMNMGSIAQGGVPTMFMFNAEDDVVPAIQAAMKKGEPVELTYRQLMIQPPGIDSQYVVTGVK